MASTTAAGPTISKPAKVIIAGNGLCGSTLALALARNGVQSQIFEVHSARSDIGGAITLAPNGCRILDHLGVWDQVKDRGASQSHVHLARNNGASLGSVTIGSVKDFGYNSLRIRRSILHQIILDALEQTGLNELHYSTRVKGYSDDKEGVTVELSDGSTVQGDWLAACDGIHSTLRELIFGEGYTPVYQGMTGGGQHKFRALGIHALSNHYLGVGGWTDLNDPVIAGLNLNLPAMFHGQSGTAQLMTAGDASKKENVATWSVAMSINERDREGWKQFRESGEAIESAKQRVKGWGPPMENIVNKAKVSELTIWPQYAVPRLPTWHKGRVVILGDAAHAIPPAGGQGASMAFEDAELLTRVLCEGGTLEAFEAARSKRIDLVVGMTKASNKTRQESTSWIGYQIKMAITKGFLSMASRTASQAYIYDGLQVEIK